MNCKECELALAGEERSEPVDRHLAVCSQCREFAVDLRENSEVFAAFREEAIPALSRRRAARWPWAAAGVAIAAMLVLAVVVPKKQTPPVEPAVPVATVTPQVPELPDIKPVRRSAKRAAKKSEPRILQVKMLTDDPDVVIYWQIEN